MDFRCTLEHVVTHKWFFITVEDCADMDDLVAHIHREFPDYTINTIAYDEK